MASVRRSFSSQVSLSSAMIFSVSWGARQSMVRPQAVCACVRVACQRARGSQERGCRALGLRCPGPSRHMRFWGIKVKYNRLSRAHPVEQGQQTKSGVKKKQASWKTLGAAPKHTSPSSGHGLASHQWHWPLVPSYSRPNPPILQVSPQVPNRPSIPHLGSF